MKGFPTQQAYHLVVMSGKVYTLQVVTMEPMPNIYNHNHRNVRRVKMTAVLIEGDYLDQSATDRESIGRAGEMAPSERRGS